MKLAGIILLALIPIQLLAAKPVASPELIEKGKKTFETNCVVCHGSGGKGDGVAAVALNPKPRNLVSDPLKAGASPEQIFGTVTGGLKDTMMQGFGATLSEEERWGLVFFILDLRKK